MADGPAYRDNVTNPVDGITARTPPRMAPAIAPCPTLTPGMAPATAPISSAPNSSALQRARLAVWADHNSLILMTPLLMSHSVQVVSRMVRVNPKPPQPNLPAAIPAESDPHRLIPSTNSTPHKFQKQCVRSHSFPHIVERSCQTLRPSAGLLLVIPPNAALREARNSECRNRGDWNQKPTVLLIKPTRNPQLARPSQREGSAGSRRATINRFSSAAPIGIEQGSLKGWGNLTGTSSIIPMQRFFDVSKGREHQADMRMTINAMDLLIAAAFVGFG